MSKPKIAFFDFTSCEGCQLSVWNALTGQGEVYFDSVTMFVFFLGLGRYIEMIARHRAGSVADALARLAPMTARRVRDGVTEDVQAVELAGGDELLVRTAEVFGADGVVLEGDGRVDESMLTGESNAIAKPPGARIHQGTHNLATPLRVRVTAVAGNTVLSGIVALLERAQAERPRLAKAADRAAAWFLGRILIGAALVFAVWWFVDPTRAFSATLSVLVVTCPCALSLATPTALVAATAALARRGVLIPASRATAVTISRRRLPTVPAPCCGMQTVTRGTGAGGCPTSACRNCAATPA